MSDKIQVIITGGTIDSVWSGSKDTVEVAKTSVLPEYFEDLDSLLPYDLLLLPIAKR